VKNPVLYPLTFRPIFKERVWGGRKLERLYEKPLPAGPPIGESWEISDRPGDESVIANGPLAGKNLRWLMEHHAAELLGPGAKKTAPFPLLVKLLDAQDKLSLQVHPPIDLATALGGEPKTEMWYIAEAEPGAEIYVGLKRGVTRVEFERKIQDGSVADCFHRVPVEKGSVMFLPSGRVHALGAGLVIFEIQQNSDTTYRVFDWHRVGLDGKPRELHVKQSLASINFEDFEPRLVSSIYSRNPVLSVRVLVDDPLFRIDACKVKRGQRFHLSSEGMQILGALRGRMEITHGETKLPLKAGEFALLPATLGRTTITAQMQIEFLHVQNR
jgi:mannose-6-phosphate isomerase